MTSRSDTPHSKSTASSASLSGQLAGLAVVCLGLPVVLIGAVALLSEVLRPPSLAEEAQAAQVVRRLEKIGQVEVMAQDPNRLLKTGAEVFAAQCTTCHKEGVLGAPQFGDKAAWAPRIATGFNALLNSALKGKNAMPAQGGGAFDELEVARAVVYMANQGGARFPEPPLPKASAASAAPKAS
jgi:cytochrome c5